MHPRGTSTASHNVQRESHPVRYIGDLGGMKPAILERLRELGQHLDADHYPRVFNDGIVALSDPGVDVSILSAEAYNEQQRQNRSAAGSRIGIR